MSYPIEAVCFICPDAPAQVTALMEDVEADECPWCKRSLHKSHDHYLWAVITGTAQSQESERQ